jgi:uncharacterized protein with HEPN domain
VPQDPTIAIRDCLAEIAVLHEIEARKTLHAFRNDPIVRRAAAYAIQTISEAVRRIPDDWLADFPTEPWGQIKAIGTVSITSTFAWTMPSSGRSSRLAFESSRHSVRVFGNDCEQYLGRLVGTVRALLPISRGPEREVQPRCKLFLREVQLLAQRANSRHVASTRELRLGR